MIDETDQESLLPEEDNNLAVTNWHKFLDIISTYIPQQTLKRRKNVPWLTKKITHHIRKRKCCISCN